MLPSSPSLLRLVACSLKDRFIHFLVFSTGGTLPAVVQTLLCKRVLYDVCVDILWTPYNACASPTGARLVVLDTFLPFYLVLRRQCDQTPHCPLDADRLRVQVWGASVELPGRLGSAPPPPPASGWGSLHLDFHTFGRRCPDSD